MFLWSILTNSSFSWYHFWSRPAEHYDFYNSLWMKLYGCACCGTASSRNWMLCEFCICPNERYITVALLTIWMSYFHACRSNAIDGSKIVTFLLRKSPNELRWARNAHFGKKLIFSFELFSMLKKMNKIQQRQGITTWINFIFSFWMNVGCWRTIRLTNASDK